MNLLRAELLKLATLPAIRFTVIGTWAVTVLLSAAAPDVSTALYGPLLAGFLILGLIAATSEYQGGQIRTTLVAAPRRVTTYVAKVGALVVITLPAAAVTVALGTIVSGESEAKAAGYFAFTTVIAHAVGSLTRRTLPALVGLLAYYFIVGPLLQPRVPFAKYLLDSPDWFVALPWTAVATSLGLLAFRSRDA
ncbi:hypothetical protein [Kribbella soli]|uniref:ABC transporter permease n=1 Tax=Kribbella soli TaxID=1124743 RepID=A0A4R0HC94_9ACTN|nr:hypothetical protein [Kribbella soli]TCC07833.1 hypothetical protein E0H45_17965 [Kribbella soli]